MPPKPSSATMVLTPWKKPLKRGAVPSTLNWSSISRILIVSCGVLTQTASIAPATSPAANAVAAPNIGVPSAPRIAPEAASKPEKRIAAFGVAKYTIESRPLYSPNGPRVRSVSLTTSATVGLEVESCCTVLVNSICRGRCRSVSAPGHDVGESVAGKLVAVGRHAPGRCSRSPRHR